MSCLKQTEDPQETALQAFEIFSDSLQHYVNQKYRFIAKYNNPRSENTGVNWTSDNGTFLSTVGDTIEWIAPANVGTSNFSYTVYSDLGSSTYQRTISVVNRSPQIIGLNPSSGTVIIGNTVSFRASVTDPDNEVLNYTWSASSGSIRNLSSTEIIWTSPSSQGGRFSVTLTATDLNGASTSYSDSIISYRIQGSVWVGNTGDNNIKLFSEEGFLIKTIHGFSDPHDIEIDPLSLNVWVLDKSKKSLFLLNHEGIKLDSLKALINPQTITVDPTTHNIWLADATRVIEVEFTAEKILKTISGFSMAKSISIGKNYHIYVSDLLNNTVYQITADTVAYNIVSQNSKHRTYSGYGELSNIAYDKSTDKLWVLDKSSKQVLFMNTDSSSISPLSHSFINPIFMRHNSVFNQTWINDDHNIVFYNNGSITSITGSYREISDIGIISYSGNNEVWIVDTFNHRILRLRDNGQIITEITGMNTPRAIGINNGSR
jgi:hypothetical protein